MHAFRFVFFYDTCACQFALGTNHLLRSTLLAPQAANQNVGTMLITGELRSVRASERTASFGSSMRSRLGEEYLFSGNLVLLLECSFFFSVSICHPHSSPIPQRLYPKRCCSHFSDHFGSFFALVAFSILTVRKKEAEHVVATALEQNSSKKSDGGNDLMENFGDQFSLSDGNLYMQIDCSLVEILPKSRVTRDCVL